MCVGPKLAEEISHRPFVCHDRWPAEEPKNRSTSAWPSKIKYFASNGQTHTNTMPGMVNQFRSNFICLSDVAVLTWIGTARLKSLEIATRSTPTQSWYGFATSIPMDRSFAAASSSPTVPFAVDFKPIAIFHHCTWDVEFFSLSLGKEAARLLAVIRAVRLQAREPRGGFAQASGCAENSALVLPEHLETVVQIGRVVVPDLRRDARGRRTGKRLPAPRGRTCVSEPLRPSRGLGASSAWSSGQLVQGGGVIALLVLAGLEWRRGHLLLTVSKPYQNAMPSSDETCL
jgi:hypothetical protein